MDLAEVRGMALQDPRTWFSSLEAEKQSSWLDRLVAQGPWVVSWWGIGAEKGLPPQMGEWPGPEQVAKLRLPWRLDVVEVSVRMGSRKGLLWSSPWPKWRWVTVRDSRGFSAGSWGSPLSFWTSRDYIGMRFRGFLMF